MISTVLENFQAQLNVVQNKLGGFDLEKITLMKVLPIKAILEDRT